MLIRLIDCPSMKIGREQSSLGLVVAQLSCLWLALASLALFEPIAVAVHFEDVDVVGQSVEQRTGSAARTRTRRYRARHSPWAERQRSVHKHRRLRAAGHGGLSNVRSLFEIFSQRYERSSTIVTSNLPFDEWTGVFGSERLTGALLDRLTTTSTPSK